MQEGNEDRVSALSDTSTPRTPFLSMLQVDGAALIWLSQVKGGREPVSLQCRRIPPIFLPGSELKGGEPEFTLQREMRGDVGEVARRRGFAAGISETHGKYLRPRVKGSSSAHAFRESAVSKRFGLAPSPRPVCRSRATGYICSLGRFIMN